MDGERRGWKDDVGPTRRRNKGKRDSADRDVYTSHCQAEGERMRDLKTKGMREKEEPKSGWKRF